MLSGRLLAALVFLAPIGLVACASDEDGAPEDVAASSDAISGAVAVGAELVTTTRVNLREGPSTSDGVLLTMPSGARVTAVAATATDGYYQVSYNGEVGWAFGAYLKATGADADDADDDAPPPVSGSFNGRKFSNVTMLWQGNWSYLVRCDSYSRAKGRVVFFCDDRPSRSFVDDGAWIAVPRANFSRSMCGDSARVCKGNTCIVAKIVEKSVTAGKWEGSTAVLKALGADTGFSGCSSSYGTATGVTVTLQ
ncbi:MAG: SH3 domain-containing protein [Labilithrix sp.]|nr:SH3 domain-containing protein [Labilithrix sp.]MCW5835956.1 SH3 domain-containing protein [Labilithrix sp.]